MSRQSDVEESAAIDVGTTKLYHEVRGGEPAVLFISSGGGDAGQWMHIAPALAEEFTVVTYDRRGFSHSPLRIAGPQLAWTNTSTMLLGNQALGSTHLPLQ